MGLFTTRQLLGYTEQKVKFRALFLELFFRRTITFHTQEVMLDKITGKTPVAAYVSPVVSGKVLRSRGGETRVLRPGYVKPKHRFDYQQAVERLPGEDPARLNDPAYRRLRILTDNLKQEEQAIVQVEEMQAVSAVLQGKYTMSGEQFETVEVDFGRSAANNITQAGGREWSKQNADTFDPTHDLDAYCDFASGTINIAIMDGTVWRMLNGFKLFREKLDKALETVAGKLRAVAYVDCAAGATLQEVVQRRQSYGARTELLRPRVQVSNAEGLLVYRPYSAFAAGLRARIDYEKGWWWSKSNQEVYNILGVEQVDEFILGERNCDANLFNMQNVSTLIRRAGFKHWGNRLCSSHPQWHFESVRRTADVIEDSIQEAMLAYVDRPLDRQNADDIIGTINAYMRRLVAEGAIFGGRAWLDPELNTTETLAAGELYINYDFGPKSPTELISMRVSVNNEYGIKEMTAT